MLCLVFTKCGAFHYDQTSPFGLACLSNAQFFRSLMICSGAVFQTEAILQCSFKRDTFSILNKLA